MKRAVALLITSTGGTMAPAAFMELRRSELFNYRLIGVNATSPVPAQRVLDRFYEVPRGESPDYLPALMEVIRKERVEIVLPASDEEAFAIAPILEDLASLGATAIVSAPACLNLIADKLKTYTNLREAGIEVPEFTPVRSTEALRQAIYGYGYPEKTVVIKPAKGRGGRGLYILCGRDDPPTWLGMGKREKRVEAGELREDLLVTLVQEETLVMPCLSEPAFDADVLSTGDDQYAVIVRQRLNPTGIPFEGNRLVSNPEVLSYCKMVARTVGLQALHDIDLMTNTEGKPVVLEVNPRPSGSLVASLAAGFPLIDWAVSRALGLPVDVHEPKRDVKILPFPCTFAVPV